MVPHDALVTGGGLFGTGYVNGNVQVQDQGIVSPGYMLGTLYVEGNYNQAPTGSNPGTLLLHTISTGTDASGFPTIECSQLDVNGQAVLGGTLDITADDGVYYFGVPLNFLSANGGIVGQFDTAQAVYKNLTVNPLVTVDPSYLSVVQVEAFAAQSVSSAKQLSGAKQVVVNNASVSDRVNTLADSGIAQFIYHQNTAAGARTQNQFNVAHQLDGIAIPVGDELFVINNVVNLPVDQVSGALSQMAGEQYTYLTEISEYSDRSFNRRVFDAIRLQIDPYLYTKSCCMDDGCCAGCNIDTWSAFEVGQIVAKGGANARAYRGSIMDVSLGIHAAITPCLIVGIAGNFESNHLSFSVGGGDNQYSGQGSLYGVYRAESFYLFSDLIVGQSYSKFHRPIRFNQVDRKAHSKPELTHGLWYGEIGCDFNMCSCLFQPFVGVDVEYVYAKGLKESNALSLNLNIDEHHASTQDSYVGLHFSTLQGCFSLNADFAWQHRFGSLGTKIHNRFIDFGKTFTINGSKYERDGIVGNINAETAITECCDFYVELSGEFWNHWDVYSGSIGLNYSW